MKWFNFAEPRERTRYIEGDWNVIDDITGVKVKASATSFQWDGMRSTQATRRHPQDFLRGTPERIRTPWARVDATDLFVNDTFTPTNDAGSGSTET